MACFWIVGKVGANVMFCLLWIQHCIEDEYMMCRFCFIHLYLSPLKLSRGRRRRKNEWIWWGQTYCWGQSIQNSEMSRCGTFPATLRARASWVQDEWIMRHTGWCFQSGSIGRVTAEKPGVIWWYNVSFEREPFFSETFYIFATLPWVKKNKKNECFWNKHWISQICIRGR